MPITVGARHHAAIGWSLTRVLAGAVMVVLTVGCGAERPVVEPLATQAATVSAPLYQDWVRRSEYVDMRDGTRIAVDIFRPARNGTPTGERLPVIFQWQRYQRAQLVDGKLTHALSPSKPVNALAEFVKHGYVVAVADVRGAGASFGRYLGAISAEEARDSYDMIAWLAAQPWSSGKVGMYGNSYAGQTQILAASEHPPALKAIFPSHHAFDTHLLMFPGGAKLVGANRRYSKLVDALDGLKGSSTVAPVDGDEDRTLLNAALAEHREVKSAARVLDEMLGAEGGFRDAIPFYMQPSDRGSQNLSARREAYRTSGVALYAVGGLCDLFANHIPFLYADWAGPKKLMMGPWSHSAYDPDDPREIESVTLRAREALRWFDYWLKGIDNGIMAEPPVRFAVMSDDKHWEWRTSTTWPPREARSIVYYLREGRSGTVGSVNDGRLLIQPPGDSSGVDIYKVDPTTTTGTATRLDNASGRIILKFPEMSENDRKALTYTTDPLDADLVAGGHPVVTLQLRSTAPDAVLVAWLEEVDGQGRSTLIAEGSIKASHRTLGTAPYEHLGLPWTTSLRADVSRAEPLNKGVATLKFPLMPTTNVFERGHRIRLTIAAADAGNLEQVAPDATITLHRTQARVSSLTLPILPARQ